MTNGAIASEVEPAAKRGQRGDRPAARRTPRAGRRARAAEPTPRARARRAEIRTRRRPRQIRRAPPPSRCRWPKPQRRTRRRLSPQPRRRRAACADAGQSVVAGAIASGIDLDVQDRRQAGRQRALEGRRNSSVFSTVSPWPPYARAKRGEVGIAQRRRDDAAGIFALLMHADRAVHAVVDDDDDDREIVLDGGGEFLPVHEEVAVAGEETIAIRSDRRAWRRSPPARRSPSSPMSGPSCCSNRRKRRKRPGQMAKLPAPLVKMPSGERRRIANMISLELDPARIGRRLLAPGQIVSPRRPRFR